MSKREVAIADINHNNLSPDLSNREPGYIEALADAMRNGMAVPPITIQRMEGGSRPYMIRDGNHRIAAARLIGCERIEATIMPGLFAVPAPRKWKKVKK